MIPGLDQAEFLRFGSIHRNTFLDSPSVLLPTLQTRARPALFIAGQLTGVEGYVESIAAGLVAGINAARFIAGSEPTTFPHETMISGLLNYVSSPNKTFQPMNANFGLLPGLDTKARGKDRKRLQSERALDTIRDFVHTLG
jgi:methylenetetrahydrofolate--tRNA-(uracil-5-)-methyltransferase